MGLGRPRTIKVREELPDLVDGIQWLARKRRGEGVRRGRFAAHEVAGTVPMLDRHRVLHNVDGTPAHDHRGSPASRRVAQARGGVAPVGHPEPLRTIVDIALAQYDVVWAAGGHPHYVFPTSYDELLRITAGEAAEIGA